MLKRFFTNDKPLTYGWLRRMYLYQILACIAIYGGLIVGYLIRNKRDEDVNDLDDLEEALKNMN